MHVIACVHCAIVIFLCCSRPILAQFNSTNDTTTAMPEPQQSPFTSSTEFYAIIGAVGGVVLIFIILLTVFCCRKCGRQRRDDDISASPMTSIKDQLALQSLPTAAGNRLIEQWAPAHQNGYVHPPADEYKLLDELGVSACLRIHPSQIELMQSVGSGSFGEIYQALYRQLAHQEQPYLVAVKKLASSPNLDESEARVKLMQEAVIMSQFRHPKVLGLLGLVVKEGWQEITPDVPSQSGTVGSLPKYSRSHHSSSEQVHEISLDAHQDGLPSRLSDVPMLVQEFMQRGPLDRLLRRADIHTDQLLKMSRDVAEGLFYLSCCNFVVGDLTARHILVDNDYNCKISAFGMSRDVSDKENPAQLIRIRWVAPELYPLARNSISLPKSKTMHIVQRPSEKETESELNESNNDGTTARHQATDQGNDLHLEPAKMSDPLQSSLHEDVQTTHIDRHFTLQTDIWAFGVVLWEIWNRGDLPYGTWSDSQVIEKVLSGHRLSPPQDCSRDVFSVMMSCWNPQPESRPPLKDLLHSLRNASVNTGLEAGATTKFPDLEKLYLLNDSELPEVIESGPLLKPQGSTYDALVSPSSTQRKRNASMFSPDLRRASDENTKGILPTSLLNRFNNNPDSAHASMSSKASPSGPSPTIGSEDSGPQPFVSIFQPPSIMNPHQSYSRPTLQRPLSLDTTNIDVEDAYITIVGSKTTPHIRSSPDRPLLKRQNRLQRTSSDPLRQDFSPLKRDLNSRHDDDGRSPSPLRPVADLTKTGKAFSFSDEDVDNFHQLGVDQNDLSPTSPEVSAMSLAMQGIQSQDDDGQQFPQDRFVPEPDSEDEDVSPSHQRTLSNKGRGLKASWLSTKKAMSDPSSHTLTVPTSTRSSLDSERKSFREEPAMQSIERIDIIHDAETNQLVVSSRQSPPPGTLPGMLDKEKQSC